MFQGSSFSQSSEVKANGAFSKTAVRYLNGTRPFCFAVSIRVNMSHELLAPPTLWQNSQFFTGFFANSGQIRPASACFFAFRYVHDPWPSFKVCANRLSPALLPCKRFNSLKLCRLSSSLM